MGRAYARSPLSVIGERIAGRQRKEVAAFANQDLGDERKPARQLLAKPRARDRPADDERARRADVDRVEMRQLPDERGRPERPVTADVDASQQNDERHVMSGP